MMKRIVTVLLAAIMTLSSGMQNFTEKNTVYAAEEKEEIPEGYIAIYDIADLYAIRNDRSGKYILMNDIDMTTDTSEGGDYDCGTGWDSMETFSGTLDGNGHRIIGMHIFGEFSFDANIGLFEGLYKANIQNLGMVNCEININLNDESTSSYIGSISGYCTDSTIFNCYSEGKILVTGQGSANIGGLLGDVEVSTLQNCYNACDINCLELKEYANLGGMHGRSDSSIIGTSYNTGNLSGNEQCGIGAICGYYYSYYNHHKNCQYLKGTASQGIGYRTDDSNCVSLTENQMKNAKLFTGYDFTDTWEIDPYCSYPYPQLKNNRMIRVKSANLKTAPSKLTYNQGDALSIGDSVLEVTYEDDIKTSVPLSLDMLSGYDMMQIGTQTVTVTYGGAETSFNIEVKEIPVASIALPETLSIYRSKEQRLSPSILPANASDKSVTWKSGDPSVASVDSSGLVKAKANGSAVITATSANGLEAKCTVTVLVPAVAIQLSQTSLTLKVGENASITAQALPLENTDTVKWRSENLAVAEVYDGLIVAKAAGTTAITAYTDSGAQAACAVTVQHPVTANPDINEGSGENSGSDNNNASLISKTNATKAKIKSAKNAKTKSIKLKLSGLSGCDGYQIQYGLKKNFKGAKSIKKKSGSVTIKKLKAKKTYYVRARAYKKIAGTTYYGKWSSKKTVKIKK